MCGSRATARIVASCRKRSCLLLGLTALLGVLFSASMASAGYLVDFSSTADLTDRFVLLQDGFSQLSPYGDGGDPGTVWSDGSKLCFDRNGPDSNWSGWDGNYYGFLGTAGSAPVRVSEAVVSIDTYLNYWDWRRGMNLYVGFFLYDPDKASGELGAWDTPYVAGYAYRWGKQDYDHMYNVFSLQVAGGDNDTQSVGWTNYEVLGKSWATHTLTCAPSLSGGYDINWTSQGKYSHTFTDHTSQDLSNVAVGLYINYYEFMDASSMGEAYMDNFSLNYVPASGGAVPEPTGCIVWGLLGMIAVSLGCRRRRPNV